MKIIVFNGSPAAKNSNTQIIAEAFLKGARRGGAETESVFLIEKKIAHCKGCFSCWFKTPGICVMQDDMTELLAKYSEADMVCFATPVYTWNMTAALKNFADRLAPLKSPLIVNEKGNFDLADTTPKTQQFMVISNCGFPGDNNFETMKAVFSSCNPALSIYRNCGKLLKSNSKQVQETVKEYLAVVEQTGFEITTEGEVSEETKRHLQMPLMPTEEYIRYLGMSM